MNESSVQLPKQPVLNPAEDYYHLRRKGIEYIEQMGSHQWTDYNTHDPGITILEALSYAITDLAYRIGWDIEDLLAPITPSLDRQHPFSDQPFFTPKDILTVNPWTPDDFRRLLIDRDGVRNAWVFCKACACDVAFYAWCEQDALTLSYLRPTNSDAQPQKVEPLGLYDVLLELESDPEVGDLNDRKIEHRYNVYDADGAAHEVLMELRFPEWGLERQDDWTLFLESADAFEGRNGAAFTLARLKFNRTKTDNTSMTDAELRNHWRNVFYVSFEVELSPGPTKFAINNAALRLFSDNFAKNQATVAQLEAQMLDKTPLGFIRRYRNKLLKVQQVLDDAKTVLHAHRNLDEDYCRITCAAVQEVSVCADVDVAPDADIERIQAEIWFQIEQYFNPPVAFYRLQELLNAGVPVEDIFNGPELSNGFIKSEELAAAQLKTQLRTSDLINRIMDIEGVIAVNNLLLSKYDSEGNITKGSVDPVWSHGEPVFDPNKSSAVWLLFLSPQHQPRLYRNQSRFLFYKNGLPLLPRMDEAADVLTQLRGETVRPRIKGASEDLPVPAGKFRSPQAFSPVQYSFPMAYGIGPAGLPSHVSVLRRAQAKQLKAYLLVFEQLLGNAFAQVAHTADLFSLDPTVRRTYFVHEFSEDQIRGYSELVNGLDLDALEAMTETQPEYLERRNKFLNHILARFGEQFGEYTLLMTNLKGQQIALNQLIHDKISFLNAYPVISHDRGKAFNYKVDPCAPVNQPGLQRRIKRLLGFARSHFNWTVSGPTSGVYTVAFDLVDEDHVVRLQGLLVITTADETLIKQLAFERISARMSLPEAYDVIPIGAKFQVILKDVDEQALARSPQQYDANAIAQAVIRELILLVPRHWNDSERCIIVEHLLLRPKFPGDALYAVCTDGTCGTCGDEDFYSFRLTFVMPGWSAPFDTNLDMRDFADRTIRQETPAHLLAKICWVSNEGFVEDVCAPVVGKVADLLLKKGHTMAGLPLTELEACDCAIALYAAFSKVFTAWYDDKTMLYFQADALQAALTAEFANRLSPNEISCAAVFDASLWADVQVEFVHYFHYIAQYGWQFERFEDAWCQWLNANASFDWTQERLHERVEALLLSHVEGVPSGAYDSDALCRCASAILAKYGANFYDWMGRNFRAGHTFDQLDAFDPNPVTLCAGFTFKPDTQAVIESFLNNRYSTYKRVSYQLWVVVNLLGKLRNVYPGATLHDCDDGSDHNPVQLDRTALGS